MVSAFAALEQRDESYHVDPKDKDPRSEEKRQLAFLKAVRLCCPAVDVFAVPNAAKRTQWAAMKAKREGMKAGVLDVVCTWPVTPHTTGFAALEFKNGSEMPDANQRDRLNMYVRQGHHAGVFRNEWSALEFLRRCGAPFIVKELGR